MGETGQKLTDFSWNASVSIEIDTGGFSLKSTIFDSAENKKFIGVIRSKIGQLDHKFETGRFIM